MHRLLTLLLIAALTGCELADTSDVAGTPGSPTSPDTSSTTVPPGLNTNTNVSAAQAEWDAISWHTGSGPSAEGAPQVMSLTATIIDDGRKVQFTYDRYPWSGTGLAHFFWWNGTTWEGGKFDHIRSGGQSLKLMENVYGGYNGLRIPASGTPVAYAWTDAKGRERSNLYKTTWP